MPVPTPSPVMRVRLLHGIGTDIAAGSRFYLAYTDAVQPTTADLNAMATFIRTTWGAQLAGQCSASNGLQQVIIDDVANATGNQGVDATLVSGTRAGGSLDQNTVVQLNFKIGRHYRGGKPKMYLPFGTLTDLGSVQLYTVAFINGLVTAWNAFIAAINGHVSGGLTAGAQVSVSYFSGAKNNPASGTWKRRNVPNPRTTPVVDPVISVTGSRFIGTQRRREGRP